MTTQQQQYYNQILQYLKAQQTGYSFCLNKCFYQSALSNIALTSGDKRIIGKYFKQQVLNNTIPVEFDYKFSNCTRCGYKDDQNHIWYKTI